METSGPGRAIDLSADVGELADAAGRALEGALISLVTTAHIATGGHVGDADSMRAAVRACRAAGTRVGAHPSYPDRAGFGRRRLALSRDEVVASLVAQLEAIEVCCAVEGAPLESIKPHGQLYHDLSTDSDLAEAIFAVLRERGETLVLAAGSLAAARALAAGLDVMAEGFCDRRYDTDGVLLSRDVPGALLDDARLAAAQAVDLAERGLEVDGRLVGVETLCVHADGPQPLATLTAVRAALAARDLRIEAPAR